MRRCERAMMVKPPISSTGNAWSYAACDTAKA